MTATALQDQKRSHILSAARQLLVKHGYRDVALDDVARVAKVAKGTLFLYFKSKDELFSAVFGELVDQLGENLAAISASGLSGKPLLEKTVTAILEHFDRNRDFMAAGQFPGCRASSSGKLLDKFAHNMKTATAILKSLAAEGFIRQDDDMETSAACLFGLCRSSILYKVMTGREYSLKERTQRVTNLFLNGVGA